MTLSILQVLFYSLLITLPVLLYKLFKHPVGLESLPKASRFHQLSLITSKLPYDKKLEKQMKYFSKYGTFATWFPGRCKVSTNEIELVKRVLLDTNTFPKLDFVKVSPKSLFTSFWGDGLVLVTGDHWKRQRRIINPCFKRGFDDHAIVQCVDETAQYLDSKYGRDIRVYDLMQNLTIEVLGRLMMKVQFDAILSPERNEFIKVYDTLAKAAVNQFYIAFSFLDKPWNPYRSEYFKQMDFLKEYFDTLLKKRRLEISENLDSEKYNDILSLLIKANNENNQVLSDGELMANVMTFFLAGHDTTALSLSATLFLLAKHPKAQKALRDEINEGMKSNLESGGNQSSFFQNTLSNLPYLNAVMYEAMRLYPAASVLAPRITSKDVHYNDHFIPKGTLIDINVMALQRDPKYWDRPNEFDPSRFLDNQVNINKMDSHWLTFGGGSRICLGMNFSLLEQRITLAKLVSMYEISLPKDFGDELPLSSNFFLATPDLKLNFDKINQ